MATDDDAQEMGAMERRLEAEGLVPILRVEERELRVLRSMYADELMN